MEVYLKCKLDVIAFLQSLSPAESQSVSVVFVRSGLSEFLTQTSSAM